MSIFYAFLLIFALLCACSNSKQVTDTEAPAIVLNTADTNSVASLELAPVVGYYTLITQSKFREHPSQSAKMIAVLEKGTTVSYLGTCDHREVIKIGNDSTAHYWMKVYTANLISMGWVYGGCLKQGGNEKKFEKERDETIFKPCKMAQIPMPDTRLIQQKVEKSGGISPIYAYMLLNFEPTSSQLSPLYLEFDSTAICSFSQTFAPCILYYEWESCEEAKGSRYNMVFPKVPKEQIIQLIEAFQSIMSVPDENKWNETETDYEPDGAGCYYHIEEKPYSIEVDIFCGC